MNEKDYIAGQQSVWQRLLSQAIGQLDSGDLQREKLIAERAETVQVLRELCEEHGDNDWPDKLYLPDVIEKHLGRHLES